MGYFAKKLQDFSSSLRRDHLQGDARDAPGHYAYAMALRVEDVLEKFHGALWFMVKSEGFGIFVEGKTCAD